MTGSVLKKCLDETKKMTEQEVKEKCEKLGLYKYDDKKYEDNNFKVILPVNAENLNKTTSQFPKEIRVKYRHQLCRRIALNDKAARNIDTAVKYGNTRKNNSKIRDARLNQQNK